MKKIHTLEETKKLQDLAVGTVTSKEAKVGVLTFIYDKMTNSLKRGVIVDIDRDNWGYTVLDLEALKWEQKTEQHILSFSDFFPMKHI